MRNQRGFLTIDFIFTIVLVLGFVAILFATTLTLTVASITQYVTFATARNPSGCPPRSGSPKHSGRRPKYQSLLTNKIFAPFFQKRLVSKFPSSRTSAIFHKSFRVINLAIPVIRICSGVPERTSPR